MSDATDAFAKIPVGQRIWATAVIPKAVFKFDPDPRTWSNMTKEIDAGTPVDKHLVVLKNNGDSLIALYGSTFGGTEALKARVSNVEHWYPVAPATNAPYFPNPLPKEATNDKNTTAWFCCSHLVIVPKNAKTIKILAEVYTPESVDQLKAAVNKINGHVII